MWSSFISVLLLISVSLLNFWCKFDFQLLLSSWKRSVLPGICGVLAGSLYRLNLFGIRKAKVTRLPYLCSYDLKRLFGLFPLYNCILTIESGDNLEFWSSHSFNDLHYSKILLMHFVIKPFFWPLTLVKCSLLTFTFHVWKFGCWICINIRIGPLYGWDQAFKIHGSLIILPPNLIF